MRFFIPLITFFLFSVNAKAVADYFSSQVNGHQRVTAIVYKNEIIFQNLLNKRYVYTIPKNGKYTLENGQTIEVKNGLIMKTENISYDDLYALGVSSGSFFSQVSKSCNIAKFNITKTMLAMDCGIKFHQYQMLPLIPDFIRMIIVSKNDINVNQNCKPLYNDENELLTIESKTDDAIIQERQLQEQKANAEANNQKLESKDAKDLKAASNQIKALKPWEFGLNDRSVILKGIDNSSQILQDDKLVFYITYFNDIGCIPFSQVKTLSCSEYAQYRDLFFDNYEGVSEFNEEVDDKNYVVAKISNETLLSYSPILITDWKQQVSECIVDKDVASKK